MKRTLAAWTAGFIAMALMAPTALAQYRYPARGVMQNSNGNGQAPNSSGGYVPAAPSYQPVAPSPQGGSYAPPSPVRPPAQPGTYVPQPPANTGSVLDNPVPRSPIGPIGPSGTYSHIDGTTWIPNGNQPASQGGGYQGGNYQGGSYQGGNSQGGSYQRPRAPEVSNGSTWTPSPGSSGSVSGAAPGNGGSSGGFVPQYPGTGTGFTPQYPRTGTGFVPQNPASGQAPVTTTIGAGPNGGGITVTRIPGQAIPWVQVNPVDVKPLFNNGNNWLSNGQTDPRSAAPTSSPVPTPGSTPALGSPFPQAQPTPVPQAPNSRYAPGGTPTLTLDSRVPTTSSTADRGRGVMGSSSSSLPDTSPGRRAPTAAARFRR